MRYYFDTSAVVKLVIREDGSDVVRSLWGASAGAPISSALIKTELLRAVRVHGDDAKRRVREVLAKMDLLVVDDAILEWAGTLDPSILRTLDAIHLASALSVESLTGKVTFDARLREAAVRQGLTVLP